MKKQIIKTSEGQIQKQIIDYLNYRQDIYFIRNNSIAGKILRPNGSVGWLKNSKRGAPDIIICFKGKWIGVEVKAKTGRQSSFQKDAEVAIRKVGGKYWVIRDLDELIGLL